MAGVNKVIIVGNLGNDPELRSFQDGSQVAVISVATSESWTDKTTGQKQERTEWHRIVLRDRGNYKLGQIAGQYLKKGSKVYVEGSLRTREYTDQSGVKKYVTEVIANNMQMLDSRQDSQQQGGYQQPQQYQAPQQQYQQPAQQQGMMPPAQNFDGFDDNIPF